MTLFAGRKIVLKEGGKPETLFPWNEQLILFTGLNVCGLLSFKIVRRLYF